MKTHIFHSQRQPTREGGFRALPSRIGGKARAAPRLIAAVRSLRATRFVHRDAVAGEDAVVGTGARVGPARRPYPLARVHFARDFEVVTFADFLLAEPVVRVKLRASVAHVVALDLGRGEPDDAPPDAGKTGLGFFPVHGSRFGQIILNCRRRFGLW